MLAILGCITVEHDLRLVVLAGLVCLFASFTAMQLLQRARLSRGRTRLLWVVGTGIVTGCGVWATHFVAMLAYRSSLAISYDIALTMTSIVAAVVLAALGIHTALRTYPERWAAQSSARRSGRCTTSAWRPCAAR